MISAPGRSGSIPATSTAGRHAGPGPGCALSASSTWALASELAAGRSTTPRLTSRSEGST